MPKWINLEFAIDKYGYSEDIIELWTEFIQKYRSLG